MFFIYPLIFILKNRLSVTHLFSCDMDLVMLCLGVLEPLLFMPAILGMGISYGVATVPFEVNFIISSSVLMNVSQVAVSRLEASSIFCNKIKSIVTMLQ